MDEDNKFDYNGEDPEQQAELEAQQQEEEQELEEQESEEQAIEEELTFEEQALRLHMTNQLAKIDQKVKLSQVPILSERDKQTLAQAKKMPDQKLKAHTIEVTRWSKIKSFFLKIIQSISPAIPYILYGLAIILAIIAVAVAIDYIFASIFGGGGTGGGSGSGGGMNSAFGATGKDFYAVRLVYKDDEQASKFILNDYSSIIYDAIDNVQNGENYTVTINLTLPEDRNADYNEETADEKIKNVMRKLVVSAYIYDNPDYDSQAIDFSTLTLSKLAEGIKYFGLNTDLVGTFKGEIVSNFLLFNFNQSDGVISYVSTGETEVDAETVKANIASALDAYFATISTVRSEKYFVKDCVLSNNDMLKDVQQKNYVAMMYLPKRDVRFKTLSIYAYGIDTENFGVIFNNQLITKYEEWPVDDDKTMYNYSLGSPSASAVTGYDPNTALITPTAVYKLVGTQNADNYTMVDENGIYTYKDFGMVIKFYSNQAFSFVDEVTLK